MAFNHEDKSTFLDGRDTARPLRPVISPSLMVADQARLLEDAQHVLSPAGGGVEWLHVDVIDGHFAPNLSFCPDTVAALRRHLPRAFLDCHLMVTEPEAWVAPFARAGASNFVFHVEAARDPVALAAAVRKAGMQVGVALRPATPLEALYPLLDGGHVDMVLVMTVVPGFAGQAFMPEMLPRIAALRSRYPRLNIQVDGAINLSTIDAVAKAGANVVVPGQAVFRAPDRRKAVGTLRAALQQHLKEGQHVGAAAKL